MTIGEMMFYGGIALFGLAAVLLIVVNLVLNAKGRKLKKMLHQKYDI